MIAGANTNGTKAKAKKNAKPKLMAQTLNRINATAENIIPSRNGLNTLILF